MRVIAVITDHEIEVDHTQKLKVGEKFTSTHSYVLCQQLEDEEKNSITLNHPISIFSSEDLKMEAGDIIIVQLLRENKLTKVGR